MSTQQEIAAWQTALSQKQQEKTAQERELATQRGQQAAAAQSKNETLIKIRDAQARGASDAELKTLIDQADRFEDAEVNARLAANQTQTNIGQLDGSIRFNQRELDKAKGALPAQGTGASTVADRPANAAANAAETAPVQQPIATTNSTTAPPGSRGGFVEDPNTGEFVAADSAQADAIRAEQNRVQTRAPVSAIEEGGEEEGQQALAARPAPVEPPPTDGSGVSEEDFIAGRNPEPVPPNLTVIQDEDGSWGIWDNDKGVFIESGYATEAEAQRAAGDPFEAARLEREAELNEERPAVFEPDPVAPTLTVVEDPDTGTYGIWEDPPGAFKQTGFATEEEARRAIDSLAPDVDLPTPPDDGLTDEERAERDAAAAQAAAKEAAINQATRQSRYKQEGSSDWRVRLQLAPTSTYLYNANPAGILAPLAATNGVVFPYTPQINTTYKANYEQYDLVHSNYRGVYYKNSRVDDLNIRCAFTAQDTTEANYLLAVIHFFRSVTKMFYGKDEQRGSPPPLVYLSGLGMNQFYGHPCVVSSFTYNLPDQVDYIRATNVNNYGTDLLSRRTASKGAPVPGGGATANRIVNAGLEKFFPANKPAPDPVVGSVNNTQLANYVPTKMEIDITLIPVQTRSQVSKQFSLKGFANGDLIKGGFW
jgi:hypothetical protein